jgi:hypothetical protein
MRRPGMPALTPTRTIAFRAAGRFAGGLTLAICLLAGAGPTVASPPAGAIQELSLRPALVGTAGESRCPPSQLSAPGAACPGFNIRDVRTLEGTWGVGYVNNPALAQKSVLQTVVVFGLAPLRTVPAPAAPSKAVLTYRVVGQSPIGPPCDIQLGVPTEAWDGAYDRVAPARPAAVAGFQGASLGEPVAWDVTPQVREWLADAGGDATFVLRGDDESLDVTERGICLSYVSDLGLAIELTTQQ